MFKGCKILLALFLIFSTKDYIIAQQFLNGDFEINTSVGDMINMQNAAFNTIMSNTTAFGIWNGGGASGGDMDIITSPTYGGGAENGLWYVALTSGGSDMIAMQIDTPLVAGITYSISYYDRVYAGYTAYATQIGLSTNDTSFGTIIYTAPIAPTSNVWTLRTFTFIAPNNGQFITVQQTGPFSGSPWCQVDNFQLASSLTTNTIATGTVSGSSFCACSSINVPFASSGTFNSGNIYTAQLSDSTGSFVTPTDIGTITSTSNMGSIACTIPCNAVAGTLYRIRVISNFPGVIGSDNGINITILTSPPTPTITQNGAVLTSSSLTGNQWYLNGVLIPGATNQTYTPAQSGIYAVIVSNEVCSSFASAGMNVLAGIEEVENNSFTFDIYPNPNEGIFNVAINSTVNSKYTIEIYNTLGQLIYKNSLKEFMGTSSSSINISEFGKGVYTFSLLGGNKQSLKKVIVY